MNAILLHLEDSDLDAELIETRLKAAGLALSIERVSERRSFEVCLRATTYDLILSDYQVPAFDGLAALAMAKQYQPQTPFIFVSGAMGEELAVETLRRGATDYILKNRLARLPAAVERALEEARERRERQKAEARAAAILAQAAEAQRLSDQRLRESEQRLSELFRLTPSLMCVLNGPTLVVERINESFKAFIGGREVTSRPVREALPDIEPQAVFELLDNVYRTGQPYVGSGERFVLQRVPGGPLEEVYIDVVYQPIRGADDEVTGILVQGIDVTDRVRAERGLREADRHKDEFLATLAHELRNPLAPVRNGLAILRLAPEGSGIASKAREMMERQLGHMVRLIDDLLDVSRVSRGKVELRPETVALRALVESAVETSRPFIDARRHYLEVRLGSDHLTLWVDPVRIAQVLSNLLNNAAKYTPDGGRILVEASCEGQEAVIRIVDSGDGIPREMLGKIFELFTQVGQGDERAQGGLGIGLSLVKKLTEMHGGSVAAESQGKGRGSVFTVRLPLHRAEVRADQSALPKSAVRGDARRNGQRILVVDDNVDGAESLAMILQLFGHQVRVINDGRLAVDVAREYRPQIVFLDIGMPGVTGYEVARQFRGDGELSAVALIALTGWGGDDDKRKSLKAGFNFHLTKPIDAHMVETLVAQLQLSDSQPS